MSDTAEIVIVFDSEQMRPACVLLQAAMGGDNHRVGALFDAASWLLAPTPGMKRFSASLDQWKTIAERVNAKHLPIIPARSAS